MPTETLNQAQRIWRGKAHLATGQDCRNNSPTCNSPLPCNSIIRANLADCAKGAWQVQITADPVNRRGFICVSGGME